MSTYNGKPYSTPRNIDLKGGILRFHATNATNPLGDETYGLYVNSSGELIFRSTTSSTTLGAAGGGSTAPSLDAIYAGDQNLAITAGSLTMAGSHVSNDVITVTATGSGDCIQITNAGTGNDIEGTSDTWHFSKAGDFTANMGVMAGDAGSNSLTLTAGDVLISDGCIALTDADDAASFTITNNTATTASVIVLAGSGTFTGSTTSAFMTLTPSGLTTGDALYMPLAAMTEGKGLYMIANVLTSGAMVTLASSATDITNTTGGLLSVVHQGATGGTNAVLAAVISSASDETKLLELTASDALSLGACLSISADTMDTGKGISMVDLDSLTTGIGMHIASSATEIQTTGRLLSVTHTGATSTSGILSEFITSATDETTVVKITTAAMVSGIALHIVGTTAMTTGSLLRATTSTASAVATNGIVSIKSTGAYTSTSNAGLLDVGSSQTVAGTLVHLTLSDASQTTAQALNITQSGTTTGYTGKLVQITGTSTTGAAVIVAIVSANTTAGTALSVTSGVTTTNGRGILLVANALTTGVGFGFAHTTTVIADGGSMMRLSSSGVDTGGTTNGTILDIASTGSVAGTLVKIYSNVASQTATCLLDIAAAGYTTGYTGSLVKMTGVSTTGAGSVLTVTGANTTAGNTVKIDAAAVTTGTGLLVTSAGVIITTGELVSLVANGATTCTGVVRASATSLTDGWVMELTGASGDTATSSGGVLHLVGAGATDGSLLRVTASGAYDSTSGIVNIIANAATTGNVMTISATALTTGSALEITANTTATGEYINCYDGANIDFKVSRYGAVTIAGNAVGTAALTVTAGDLVLTAGTAIYREKTEVVTTTNTIGAAESGTTFYLNSAGGFTSTLPAPAAGLHFKFVVKTAPTTSYIITTNAAANVLYGKIFERAGTAGVAGAAADVINFVANNAIAGDTYLFDCDGTNWYITGSVDVAAGCTFATD